ncbi:MAG: type II secretion system protein, partial [Raoultibacter sp.]
MLKAKNDTRGFTLAELLMSIAIIFILVLIALPTVVSTQKNMHMLELNNAANQVATAVQTQMTADKVSGTWLEKIDAVPNAKAQKATGLVAADIKNEANIYYLNADQVRDNNLLPPAGIDSSVRESDYVLEYDATTAVVCGVFYSDNKGGWLSSGKATGTAAQTYYQASQSPNKRDEAKRRDADPMIGYFGGRAAGATEGIALAKPVIWVDSEGQLCVQDANLRKKTAPYDAAALQLTLTAPNGKTTFTLMGLQQSATTYTIKTNTATTETFTNADTNKIFQLVSAADDVSNNKDIYQIDLNQLKKAMEAASKNDDLKRALADFNIGDLMRVEASVTVGVPCVPATALANTPWPGPVAQLRVLVTNPSIDGEIAKDPAKDKGYTTPQVAIEGKVPAAVPLTKDKEEIKFGQVVNKDAESARQVYTGAKMNLQTAVEATPDGKATANAQAGAYTNANKTKHSYQIYEIWVGNTLAGSYGPEGTWVWNPDPALATLPECFTFAAGTQISAPPTAVFISAPKLNAISSLRNEVGGYDVYVRTAPSLRDAQDYFDQNNSFRAAICNGNVTARGVDGQSTQAQAAFKEEFGCTSSVALWTVTRKKFESSVSGFDWKDLYLYYAPTPLRPAAKPQAKGQHNDLTCAVLWRYASPSAGQANPKDFARKDNQAPAFAQNATSVPQLQGQEVSRAQIVAPQNFMNEKPLDFLIPLDDPNMDPPKYPATDQLYFRYVKYYEKNDGGSMIIQQQQWVPLFARDLKSNESKNGTTFARPLKKDEFTFWNVAQDGSGASFKAGTSIAEQSRSLPLGAVSLYAQYATVGLLYVEFDGPFNPFISGVPQGSVTGYYGSLDGKTIVKNGSDPALLPTNNKLSSWGYCLATKPGQGAPVCPRGYQAPDKLGPYTLQGSNYDLYPLKPEPTSTSADGSTQVLQFAPAGVSLEAGPTYTYTVNLNFAAAVEVASNKGDAQRWGRDPEKGGLPWQVRHADQLIMNLKSTEAKTVYGTSSTTFFNQTHDIDWNTAANPGQASLHLAFKGT